MKKTTKKNPAKPSQKKATKDLEVKPAKGGAVRGGLYDEKLGGSGGGGGGPSGGGGTSRPK